MTDCSVLRERILMNNNDFDEKYAIFHLKGNNCYHRRQFRHELSLFKCFFVISLQYLK